MAQAWKTSLQLITQSNFFPPQHHPRLRQVVDTMFNLVQVRLEVRCRLPSLPPLPALTHKERNQSHKVDWSLLMREDAKSKKKAAGEQNQVATLKIVNLLLGPSMRLITQTILLRLPSRKIASLANAQVSYF